MQNRNPLWRHKSGFTLVELLVVVAVIGILMGLVFPAVQAVRNAARQTSCRNNIRQLALATLSYNSSHLRLPPADDRTIYGDGSLYYGGSWVVSLLPHLEQPFLLERLYDQTRFPDRFDRLRDMSNSPLQVLICPSATDQGAADVPGTGEFGTHYYGILGPAGSAAATDGSGYRYFYDSFETAGATTGTVSLEGVFAPSASGRYTRRTARSMDAINDGASNTILYAEISKNTTSGDRAGWAFGAKYEDSGANRGRLIRSFSQKTVEFPINWSELDSVNENEIPISSFHSGGAMLALADASVRFIDQGVDLNILKVLSSRDGGWDRAESVAARRRVPEKPEQY